MVKPPPRFVPTLTEVVPAPPAASVPTAQGQPASPPLVHAVLPGPLQEQIIHRVMQRVDVSLERRLREAIATVVLEQTRLLGPLLKEEIELVVRQSVSEAVAAELALLGRSET
ncbi:MAG: hypothetical protein Q8K31_03090 [Burkholderiaceae bacterium]|nr:hypothetical protein [Burkholderiaceae bacterium]MDO9089365.1 hypothetical protein [Burkholderiaceae bacterium]MDP1968156.1 hypothetical protein [Burkholderiaceae bacterium]